MTIYYPAHVYRDRRILTAKTVRDALLFTFLLHATLTILMSPRRQK